MSKRAFAWTSDVESTLQCCALALTITIQKLGGAERAARKHLRSMSDGCSLKANKRKELCSDKKN